MAHVSGENIEGCFQCLNNKDFILPEDIIQSRPNRTATSYNLYLYLLS